MQEDTVRVRIDFMTDESGKFAKTILETQKFNKEIKKAQEEVNKLEKEIEGLDRKDRASVDKKLELAEAQRKLTEAINGSLTAGQSLSKIDLRNVAPAQLQERLRQVNQQLKQIPENVRTSHPEAKALKDEADRIGAALATVNARAKAIAPALNSAKSESSGLHSIFQQAFSVFLGGGLLQVVQKVIGALSNFGSVGLKAVDDFEQAKIAFETMIGSATVANDLIAKIVQKAAKTPFEQSELIDYAKRLLAMGIETEKILPTMDALGNIAAGVGKEKLPQLVLAFGQVQTKTKLAGGELKQFSEAGVPLIQALADQFGKTGAEIMKMSENGQISFKDVEKAIFAMSQEGGKFYNLMGKQATTLGGVMSTLKDNFTIFAKNFFTGIAEYMKPVIEGFSKFFDNFNKAFEDLTPKMTILRQETDKERTSVNLAVEEITKYTVGSKERKVAIEQLRAIHPLFMKDLKTETATNEQLRDRLQEVNQQYQAKIIAIAAGKQVEEALNKEKNTQEAIGKDRLRAADNIVKAREYLNDYTSSVDVLVQKLRTEFQNSSYFSKHRREAQDLIFSLQNYKENNISLSVIEGKSSDATVAAKKREKQVIDELKKQYPEIAAQLDIISKAADGTTEAAKKTTSALTEAVDGKAAKKAEKDRLTKLKEQNAVNLGEAEIYWDMEVLLQQVALSKKEITKAEFAGQELILDTLKYENLLAIQTAYLAKLSKGTKEYVHTQKEMLDLSEKIAKNNGVLNRPEVQETQKLGARTITEGVKSDTVTKDATLDKIQADADIQKMLVKQKFIDLITIEQNMEGLRLEIQKKAYADQRTEIEKLYRDKIISAQEYGVKMVALGEKEKKNDADIQKNKEQLAHIEDEHKKMIHGMRTEAVNIAVDLMQSNLSQEKQVYKEKSDLIQARMDELKKAKKEESAEYKKLQKEKEAIDKEELAARKKAGAAIKAFQIAQIVLDGIAEVQAIWKSSNMNALNFLFPGAGELIAGVKTALAVGRSTAAINRVNAQQFATGGIAALKSGIFGGNSHSNGGTKGYFEDGTQIEVEHGEAFAIVNKKNTPLLKALSLINSHNGNGRQYFADGGVMNLNTNPSGYNASQSVTSVQVNFDAQMIADKLDKLTQTVAAQQTQFKAYVVVDEFEAKQTSISKDRQNAAY